MTTDDDENLCTSPFGVANSDVRYTGRLSQWRAGCFDAMEPDDAWYVEPRIRVTGPSVRDISLYPEGEGARLLREDLAFRRKSVGNEAGFRRVRRAMHKRPEKTPVAALGEHPAYFPRAHRPRARPGDDPSPRVVDRLLRVRGSIPARAPRGFPKNLPGAPERPEYPTPRRVPEEDAEEGAEKDTPRGTMMTDGMRHLPEGFQPATTESRERRLARKLVRTLGKVIAPHASWEGGGTETRAEEGDVSGSEGESNGTARAVGGAAHHRRNTVGE